MSKERAYLETPLWNNTLSTRERLDYLIQEMTLEEKIQCMTTRAPKIERLGINPFHIGGEAAHGVEARRDQSYNFGRPIPTTSFTQPIGMSTTWDKDLIKAAGEVVGTEARAIYKQEAAGGLSRWAPTIDMERDPRWGRTEEAYGEDPYLVGNMASSYIKGLQGEDAHYLRCAATLKHFYGNNVEKDRVRTSTSIDCRNKYEYYLEPFKRAVVDGRAEAIMTAYNEINGIPAIVNEEVQKIAKDTWGLRGHVVCDGGDFSQTVTEHKYYKSHAETIKYGLQAGIDCFTDDPNIVYPAVEEALSRGLITEEDLNKAIRNSFSTKIRLGLYDKEEDKCPYNQISKDTINTAEHIKVCKEVARKSMVLLKNEDDILPLKKDSNESIAVVGLLSDVWYKDWYSGIPPYYVTPLHGIKKELANANIITSDGLHKVKLKVSNSYIALKSDGSIHLSNCEEGEVFIHTDWGFNNHTFWSTTLGKYLTINDENQIKASKDEVFGWFIKEAFHLEEINKKENEADRELSVELREDADYYIRTWNDCYVVMDDEKKLKGLSITELEGKDLVHKLVFTVEIVEDGIETAKREALKADKVIAVLGCNPMINAKEEIDRPDIILPPMQSKLLQEIRKVNENIILVLITNYPYAINWEQENIKAILTCATGSQELGTGIAEVLSGAYSPSGRLNMTWYKEVTQLPLMEDYDIIRGERTYQYFKGEVLYPFGHGLSYTSFEYSDIKVVQDENLMRISCNIKNITDVSSDEVVQLYVSQEQSRTKRPRKQLKGFERIYLKGYEEKEVIFQVPYDELQYYDVVCKKMVLEDSIYTFKIGASSEDIRLNESIAITGSKIGTRNLWDKTDADHYDTYSNIDLHKGYDGKPCIKVARISDTGNLGRRNPDTRIREDKIYDCKNIIGEAIYNDVMFTKVPRKCYITGKALGEGDLEILFDDVIIGSIALRVVDEYSIIDIPLLKEIPLNKVGSLTLRLRNDIRIVEFWFED